MWAAAALLVGLAELHAPGFYLIWIAAGAGITAIGGFLFGLPLEGEFILFAAASIASCGIGYFVYQRMGGTRAGGFALNERGRQIIGAHGVVTQSLTNGQGRVRLGDTVWIAEGPDLPEGTAVVVTATRGTIAVVTPKEHPS